MLIYKIIKDKLEDKDLESASRIECDDNNIVVLKYYIFKGKRVFFSF